MPSDLFRLIKDRNRQAFDIEGRNGKNYRTRLIQTTLQIEEDLRKVLASNYISSITGPNYTIALRAYAIEFSKMRLALEDIQGDNYFATPAFCDARADLTYQKVAYLLGANKDLRLDIFSSQEFCKFLLAMVEIFFGGSTPANIKKGIELFVGQTDVVTIRENFLDAMDPTSPFDISDQFGFRVDFEITEEIASEFSDIGIKLDFLLKLIKPAHTLYLLRFLFSDDASGILDKALDVRYVDQVCDHDYDDARKYCEGVAGRDRLGVNTVQTAIEDKTGMGGTRIFTDTGPISQNLGTPSIGGPPDVQVLVDGLPVAITSVAGAAGIIHLAVPVNVGQTVVVTYYYWHNTTFGMLLNQPGRVLNGGPSSKFPVRYVLNHVEAINPATVDWDYTGYQRHYTAVLNDPTSLLLNQPPHKISDPDTGLIYGHRHVLNWANVVRSPDLVRPDGKPEHILNEGTPIWELREAFNPSFEYVEPTEPDVEGWGISAWGSSPWGAPTIPVAEVTEAPHWETLNDGGKFLNPLNVTTSTEGTVGLLTIACDNGLQSMDIISPYEDAYEFPEIPNCDNSGLFIFNQSTLNGPDLLNNFAGVAGCELTVEMVMETPFEDVSTVPSSATDDPPQAVAVTGEEDKVSAWNTAGMFIFNQSTLNGPDVLWNNEAVEHWNDEGNITVIFGGTFHLPSNSPVLTPGAP